MAYLMNKQFALDYLESFGIDGATVSESDWDKAGYRELNRDNGSRYVNWPLEFSYEDFYLGVWGTLPPSSRCGGCGSAEFSRARCSYCRKVVD